MSGESSKSVAEKSSSINSQDFADNAQYSKGDQQVSNTQEEVEITAQNIKIEYDNQENEQSTPEKAKDNKLNDQLLKQEIETEKNMGDEHFLLNIQEDIEITIDDVKIEASDKENMKKTRRSLVCIYCDSTFNNKSNYNRHLKAIHQTNADGEKVDISIVCEFCGKKFYNKYNLQQHQATKHLSCLSNQNLFKPFECPDCKYSTQYKSNFKRHSCKNHEKNRFRCSMCEARYTSLRGVKRHEQIVHSIKNTKELKRSCPLCDFISKEQKLDEMHTHFQNTHKIQLQWEEHKFPSKEEFQKWKEEVEMSTTSSFVKSGNKGNLEIYRCHRCGNNRSKGSNKRNSRKIKSCKIGGFCPAKIVVKSQKGEEINVSFLKNHVGHENELKYKRLTKSERKIIVDKLSLKVPVDQIVKDIRSSIDVNSDLQRIHLINKKDIQNIRKSLKLDDDESADVNDNCDSFCNNDSEGLVEANVINVVVPEFMEEKEVFEDSLKCFVNDIARNITNMEELNLAKQHFASLLPTLESMRQSVAAVTSVTKVQKLPVKNKTIK